MSEHHMDSPRRGGVTCTRSPTSRCIRMVSYFLQCEVPPRKYFSIGSLDFQCRGFKRSVCVYFTSFFGSFMDCKNKNQSNSLNKLMLLFFFNIMWSADFNSYNIKQPEVYWNWVFLSESWQFNGRIEWCTPLKAVLYRGALESNFLQCIWYSYIVTNILKCYNTSTLGCFINIVALWSKVSSMAM